MARLIPLTVDTDETVYLAVQLRAAKCGVSSSEVVNAILRTILAAEIADVSGMPPLAALIQDLHERSRSRQANASPRPVLPAGNPSASLS
jgi:hypothetical protein